MMGAAKHVVITGTHMPLGIALLAHRVRVEKIRSELEKSWTTIPKFGKLEQPDKNENRSCILSDDNEPTYKLEVLPINTDSINPFYAYHGKAYDDCTTALELVQRGRCRMMDKTRRSSSSKGLIPLDKALYKKDLARLLCNEVGKASVCWLNANDKGHGFSLRKSHARLVMDHAYKAMQLSAKIFDEAWALNHRIESERQGHEYKSLKRHTVTMGDKTFTGTTDQILKEIHESLRQENNNQNTL